MDKFTSKLDHNRRLRNINHITAENNEVCEIPVDIIDIVELHLCSMRFYLSVRRRASRYHRRARCWYKLSLHHREVYSPIEPFLKRNFPMTDIYFYILAFSNILSHWQGKKHTLYNVLNKGRISSLLGVDSKVTIKSDLWVKRLTFESESRLLSHFK